MPSVRMSWSKTMTDLEAICGRMHMFANRLHELEDKDLSEEAEWLHSIAWDLAQACCPTIREGTAANYLQHRLPAEPFTALELAEACKMNLRTVQQALVDLRAAGKVEACGVRRRQSGKGQHPRLYRRCA